MANRTIAIGDIHGCADALQSLLEVIQPQSTDTIITLGDYIDRGPKSSAVISILADLITECTLVPLLGNHEIMMTNALKSRREFEFWMFNGGKATLASYDGDMNNMPMHHRTFVNFCKPWHETETHIFLHAAYDPTLPMEQQPDDLLFWRHIDENFTPPPHYSGKTIICGHTPQIGGDIGDVGHIKLIDTFCYGDQWLTAFDVDSGHYIQARADGMLRPDRSEFPKTRKSISVSLQDLPESWQVKSKDWPISDKNPSPLELDGQEFQQVTDAVTKRLAEFLDDLDAFPVKNSPPSDAETESIIRRLSRPIPREPAALEDLLDLLFDDYIPTSFNTAGQGYLAYIPGGGLPESAIADLIASVTNRFSSAWVAAPAMAEIESCVIRWFCDMVGYDKTAGGFLTTGGSIANMAAIVAARVKMLSDDFRLARIYASAETHHCVAKAAFLAGFPQQNLRKVSVDDQQRINLLELQQAIDSDRAAGFQPVMVVANAGTTNTGAVDDLMEIHQICRSENLWMHVDAAYGGFFMLTDHGRRIMRGIEHADSIVLDPHKGLFLPYGTGSLLMKRRDDLVPAFSFTSDYMPTMSGDEQREDFCNISPELSRDNRGLRVWLPLMLHGVQTFESLLNEKLNLTKWMHARLVELNDDLEKRTPSVQIEVIEPPQLSILAFRLHDPTASKEQNNELNRRWLDEINRDGSIMISSTLLDGKFILRICVLNFRTHIERMQKALHVIATAIQSVLKTTPVDR